MTKSISSRRAVAALSVLLLASSVMAGCDSGTPEVDRAALGPDNPPNGEPILIGGDFDTTGPAAAYNIQAKQGAELAIEVINREGGVLDRPLQLISENSASDPAQAPTVYNSLIDQDVSAIIGYVSVGIPPVKQVVEDSKVLTVAAAATDTSMVSTEPANYLYNVLPGTETYADVLCSALEAGGYENVALFHDDAPGVLTLVDGYKKFITDCLPNGFVAEEGAALDSTDFIAPVARLASAKPDAVLTVSVGGTFEANAHSAITQMLPDVQQFAIGSFEGQPESWKIAQAGALDGLITFRPYSDENARYKEIEKQLAAFNPDAVLGQATLLTHASVLAIVDAIKTAGSTDDPDALNEAFQQIEGLQTSLGQPNFTMSYSKDKHVGADGGCALALVEFGPDNTIAGPWSKFQPAC